MLAIVFAIPKNCRPVYERRKIVSISIALANVIAVINVHSFTIVLESLFVHSMSSTFVHVYHLSSLSRFLNGRCKNSSCPYSHELTPGKVPTCSYFIKGACGQDNCPYAHSYVGHDAQICDEFVQGFCSKGTEVCVRRICSIFSKISLRFFSVRSNMFFFVHNLNLWVIVHVVNNVI